MGPLRFLLSFPLLLLLVICSTRTAQAQSQGTPNNTFIFLACNPDSRVRSGSMAMENIRILVPQLVAKTLQNGYVATSYGQNKDKIYGLAQCRGDVSKKDCADCIKLAGKRIRSCSNKADTTIWYDYCFMRYNKVNFFNKVETGLGIYSYSNKTVSDPKTFNANLGTLLNQVGSQAFKPANHGFGKGKIKLPPSSTIYGLLQCTRDLSPANCRTCLTTASDSFREFCGNQTGCQFAYSSCYVRYDLQPFYFPLDPASTAGGASAARPMLTVVSASP